MQDQIVTATIYNDGYVWIGRQLILYSCETRRVEGRDSNLSFDNTECRPPLIY